MGWSPKKILYRPWDQLVHAHTHNFGVWTSILISVTIYQHNGILKPASTCLLQANITSSACILTQACIKQLHSIPITLIREWNWYHLKSILHQNGPWRMILDHNGHEWFDTGNMVLRFLEVLEIAIEKRKRGFSGVRIAQLSNEWC